MGILRALASLLNVTIKINDRTTGMIQHVPPSRRLHTRSHDDRILVLDEK